MQQELFTDIRERNASDILGLRKRLHRLHSALRNEGYHALEAVMLLSSALERHEGNMGITVDLSEILNMQRETGGAEFSVAFQEFLGSEARNGLGQYLTPLPVADLIAAIVAKERPANVLDPFAGSGLLLERFAEKVPGAHLRGIEINHQVASIARAVGKLSSHNLEILEDDAFSIWANGEIPECDAVLTNPPFGAVATTIRLVELSPGLVPDALLCLGSPPAELLGLELSVSVLRNGGFLAIVLPQSVLTNARWQQYRANLFKRIRPIMIVSLPEEAFAPFGGVANACVLFATKEANTLPGRFSYVRSQSVGYDQTGRPVDNSDLLGAVDLMTSTSSFHNGVVNNDGVFVFPSSAEAEVDHTKGYALGDIAAAIFTGRTLPRDGYTSNGPRILKVGDLSGSFIAWRERPRTHVPRAVFEKNLRCHLRVGDICLTCAAHRPRYIGLKVDIVDELPPEGAMASAEVLVIRLKPDAPITPEQLLFYLRSKAGYSQVQDMVRGSTAHLYPSDVVGLFIPSLGEGGKATVLREKFGAAAAAFREYLRIESEAVALAAPEAG